MKLSVVLAAGLILTASQTPSFGKNPFGKFIPSLPGNAGRAVEQVIRTVPKGGRTTSSGSGATAAAIFVTVVAVGVLMAHENQQRANPGSTGKDNGKDSPQAAPSRPLSQRDIERETWKRIQNRLNELGFDAGGADGVPGPKTRSAVESFQASIGFEMTGRLTPEQTALLYASATDAPEIEAPEVTTTLVETGEPSMPASGAEEPLDDLVVTPPVARAEGPGVDSAVSASLSPTGAGRRAIAPESTVLGIRPLSELSAAEESLREDYGACERTGSTLVCTASREGGVSDTLVVAYSQEGTREVIHTLSRELAFERPVPRADIVGQLSGAYSDLIFVPDMTLASTRDCVSRATSFQESRFEPLLTWARSGAEATSDISALAEACDFYYTIDIPDGERLERVAITLFTGAPLRQAQLVPPGATSDTPQIRF